MKGLRSNRLVAAAIAVGVARLASAADAAENRFDKGTWTFQAYGGYVNDLGPYDVEAGYGSFGFGYYFVDGMSLSAELSGFGISQPGDNAVAGSAGIVFRHHLFTVERSSIFVDVAAALFEANKDVPSSGTRFNFVTQFGVGVAHEVRPDTNLLLGVRFFHLSNANIEGDDRNPAINAVNAYVGVMFKL